MSLTASTLVKALATCAGGVGDAEIHGDGSDELPELVIVLRHAQPTFAPTLLAAWEAEGHDLNPGLRYELESARARVAFYRALDASLTSKVPGLTSVKGLEITDLYPDGLTRHMNDLDYVASTEADLWQAADHLLRDGWSLYTATFSQFRGSLNVMVSLMRPNDDPYQIPHGVELTTYYSIGNFGAINPLMRLRREWRLPAIKNILMLLYERYEQRFRARDLVDAWLLHGELGPGEIDELHRAVVTLRLGVEYAELVALVEKSGLGSLPAWPAKRVASGLIRAQRLAKGAGYFLRPAAGTGRNLQRRLITGDLGRADGAVWNAVQRYLDVPAAMSGGLLAFGLPLDVPPPKVDGAILRRRGTMAWADTPIARFLLTLGDFVEEDHVAELTKGREED